MFFITIEFYKNAKVNVIKDSETDNYFWVEMKDVENGLGLKCIRSLIRKEICGIHYTDNLTKEKKKYIRSKFEIIKKFRDKKSKYVRNDIMEKSN